MSSISRRLFVQAGAMVTLAGVAVQRGWPANAAPYTKDGTVDGHLGARGASPCSPTPSSTHDTASSQPTCSPSSTLACLTPTTVRRSGSSITPRTTTSP